MTKFLFIFVALTNVLLVAMVTLQSTYITERMVFDIDKVRMQCAEDIRYWYGIGCEYGVDYPQEYRNSMSGWNPNSPPAWCAESQKMHEDAINELLFKLGR